MSGLPLLVEGSALPVLIVGGGAVTVRKLYDNGAVLSA